MSEQEVDVIRQGWDAWIRGDLPGLYRIFDSEIVWDTSHFPGWPEAAYHGIEGVERFLTEWLEVWDHYKVDVEQVFAAPDGRVVTLLTHHGQGRESGVPMDMQMAQIATLRDGKVTRLDNYENRDEALEAAGLGP